MSNTPIDVEFDHPFTLDADGNVHEAPDGFYAPEVYLNKESGEPEVFSDAWWLLFGYTSNGRKSALMHSSEYVSARMLRQMAEDHEAGTVFVFVVVETYPGADESYCTETEPAGWAILANQL